MYINDFSQSLVSLEIRCQDMPNNNNIVGHVPKNIAVEHGL